MRLAVASVAELLVMMFCVRDWSLFGFWVIGLVMIYLVIGDFSFLDLVVLKRGAGLWFVLG